MSKAITEGQTVNVHYVGTLDDGTEFDSSRSRGETISFCVGAGNVIKGFDSAVIGMSAGETKKVRVEPKDGYGEPRPEMFQNVPRTEFPPDMDLETGGVVRGQAPDGKVFAAIIESLNDDGVRLDFNHPMAGKHLNFEIEVVSADQE